MVVVELWDILKSSLMLINLVLSPVTTVDLDSN